MVRYTLRQCTYFIAVVDHGGIAQAARALNVSQPAVAQAIDKLEDQYGFRLLNRLHAKGSEVTPEGRSFAVLVRGLLKTAGRVEDQARTLAANLSGVIRFGCFHTIAPFYQAGIATTFQSRHPDIEIIISEHMQEDILAGIETDSLDIALTYDMGLEGRDVRRVPLTQVYPHILLWPDHPLAGESRIHLADLADEAYVMFDGPASEQLFHGILLQHGLRPPIAARFRSMESVRCAVARGLGFTLSVMKPEHNLTYNGGQVVPVAAADDIDPVLLVLLTRNQDMDVGVLSVFERFCIESCA